MINKQLIIIGSFCLVLITAVVGKRIFFPSLDHDSNAIFWMFMALCSIIIVVLCINQLIEGRRNRCSPKGTTDVCRNSENRRKSFRVTYPENQRPIFIVEIIDNHKNRPLEYSVVDISEEGIRFANDGSLGQAKMLAGRLQFFNGEIKTIACQIVRRDEQYICAQLKHSITWATLIREQRRMIERNNRC